MKKKYFALILLILIIFLVFFVLKNMIKKSKNGNDISSQKIVDTILNMNSYKTETEVEVISNKNKNKYIFLQEYSLENGCMQEVIKPDNLQGIKIIKKGNNLTIENTELSLKKIFENYEELENNDLDLYLFLEQYKNSKESYFEEKDKEIIMYFKNKKLYINKENNMPEKLLIQDNNRNTKISIKYTNIEFN